LDTPHEALLQIDDLNAIHRGCAAHETDRGRKSKRSRPTHAEGAREFNAKTLSYVPWHLVSDCPVHTGATTKTYSLSFKSTHP
jgi:hypothetical protein